MSEHDLAKDAQWMDLKKNLENPNIITCLDALQ